MMFFFSFDPIGYPQFGVNIDKAYRALRVANMHNPNMSVSTLATLLYVGRNQERIVKDRMPLSAVAKEIGIPYTSFTRHADALGEGIGKRGGLGFVERGIDKANAKGRVLTLTSSGLAIIRSIEAAMACEET